LKKKWNLNKLFCYVIGNKKTLTTQPRIFKAQVWAIVKIVTNRLNLVVITCVMSQSRGHYLLSNALTITINLIMVMEFETDPFDVNETFDLFDVELHTLKKKHVEGGCESI
jgi:hypothetical protein